jgi:biopolymer transport protein ExbD
MPAKNQKYFFSWIALVCFSLCTLISCSAKDSSKSDTIIITISVKDEIFVNGDPVSPDSLRFKLKELAARGDHNIRIVPDPEAGMGIIDKVQRTVSLYKNSLRDSAEIKH